MNSNFARTLINNIDAGIIITDLDFKIRLINQVALNLAIEVTGKTLSKGDDIRTLLKNLEKKYIKSLLAKIASSKDSERTFFNLATNTGGELFLDLNIIPIRNQDNQQDHYEFIINDITQQKLFETKLVNQAKNISNFIEKAHAIIIGVDTRGYITEWNEFASVTTGYKKNDVYALKLVDKLIPEEHRSRVNKIIERVIHKKNNSNYEISICTNDQSHKIVLLGITQRLSATGEVIGATLMGQDITELSQYRQSLERKVEERTKDLEQSIGKEKEVLEMKNRFISIASHEFRTPLDSIQYNAADIKKNKTIQKSRRLLARINEIEKHAQRMTLLLDDVLTYNKSEPGKINLILHSINLPEFLNKTSEEVYLSTKQTHVIKKEFFNLPKFINTDEKLLRNILINLLTNAIKYSPGKNHVSLVAKGTEEQLEIDIRDNGIGIPMPLSRISISN
ncbi:hypothetical protein MASR2M41_25190 [Flammeovirgaceae bacterium]